MRAKLPARALAALAAMAFALGGCATIPDSGPVEQGDPGVVVEQPALPISEGPRPGDTPTEIVTRFVTNAWVGFTADFSVAREYLTFEAGRDWDPAASVVIIGTGKIEPTLDEAKGTLTYSVPVVARLDADGRMIEELPGYRQEFTFLVSEEPVEKWRISELDDGVLILESNFVNHFRPVTLTFATKDGEVAVPEVRWLPNKNIQTRAAAELIEGPSPWLADAVATGFPPSATLAVDSVPISAEGVAGVSVLGASQSDPASRSLMTAQINSTLIGLPGVSRVSVTSASGLPFEGDRALTLSPAQAPAGAAVAVVGDTLGLWDGQQLFALPDGGPALPPNVSMPAMSYDGTLVAFIVDGRTLVTTPALGSDTAALVPYVAPPVVSPSPSPAPSVSPSASPSPSVEPSPSVGPSPEPEPPPPVWTAVLPGTELVAPSFDRSGWVWTSERRSPGELTAVAPDGTVVAVPAHHLEGHTIESLEVSRDGARIAVLSTIDGSQNLQVMGVWRAADGTPQGVGEPEPLAPGLPLSQEVTWIDPITLAVLGTAAEDVAPAVTIVTVGGRSDTLVGVANAASVTGRNGAVSLVLTTHDGDIYIRSGNGWRGAGKGATWLAHAG